MFGKTPYEQELVEITRDWKDKLFDHKLWCNDTNREAYKHIIGGTLKVYSSCIVEKHYGKRITFIVQEIPSKPYEFIHMN
jgi:hypothetical protein